MVDTMAHIFELQRLQIYECSSFKETLQIREFVTAVTHNISDLEGRPWKSKLLRMPFLA